MPGSVKRAVDYIHAHLQGRIDMATLVAISGASRRSLEQAFRNSLGTSPARYIMSRRLLAIRERLLRGDTDAPSLAELAFHWGFSQPSHFTAAYRQAFAESPSQTLARRVTVGT
ncbi:HTH-type transcriptional activator RhaS [compost metagenome]